MWNKTNLTSKKKIINDPIYGLINIPGGIIFDLIEHKYFQRLRRIKQLGLTYLVYPGAIHSRFQHSIGAMYLTSVAIEVIKSKGTPVSEEEEEALKIAILLHDIGHTPFSHSLEKSIVTDYDHEQLSLKFMNVLNDEFGNRLETAIQIFKGLYHKKFLHQLVAGQLDMDRMDYLKRDSFFSGVSEGVISTDRIIKMLTVVNDKLVVEAKGVYSIEKFLIARRLMYWQVYLHKTALGAELILTKLFKRAKYLFNNNQKFPTNTILNKLLHSDFDSDKDMIETYAKFDDYDVYHLLKQWATCGDFILKKLSQSIINRNLPGIILSKEPVDYKHFKTIKNQIIKEYNITDSDAEYFVFKGSVSNNAYSNIDDEISVLYKNQIIDISKESDMLNLSILNKVIKKYYVCAPKELLFK